MVLSSKHKKCMLKKKSKKKSKKLNKKTTKKIIRKKNNYSLSITSPILDSLKNKLPSNIKDLIRKKSVKHSSWIGTGENLFYGMLYLLKTHKNDCMPFKQFSTKYELMSFENISIIWECYNYGPFRLYLPGGPKKFFKNIEKCSNNKRFILLPLFMSNYNCDMSGHQNMIIIDVKNKTIERFEPYGINVGDEYTEIEHNFDKAFGSFLSKMKKYTYIPPQKMCIKMGLQAIEEDNIYKGIATVRKNDPFGFCVAWSIWYADLRMRYPDASSKELLNKTINILKNDKITMRRFIRNYAEFIIKQKKQFKKEFLKDVPLVINKKTKIYDLEDILEHKILEFIYKYS